ncbi:hypothetical protein B296_00011139 [Ensete ventricosum]|uniref:Uncharacterized protein n=1 Tax=Ensete ventricosum TaxID=4639 RepID=A0A427AFZ7_ENSVE|nr:hypothetical protein B296_00011139 [Ensete ventricosum]
MDGYVNTSEEVTSSRGTKSASDLESEVEVPEHDAAWPMPINAAWRPMPSSHAAAAARPPYVSVISRGTTKDRHPRDGLRDKPTELCVENPRRSINPRRKFRPPPTLADLRTQTRTGRADTSARLLKVS